jgi:DNA-binding HxlR family transcriptional regulator
MTHDPEPARPAPYPSPPQVGWTACPIETSLGSLGRRWTIPILRDIAFFPKANFALIQKRNPGLGPRTLSLRLAQLAREGLVRKVVPDDDPRHPHYELTPKGLDVWPILSALFQFGIQHHAATVFPDQVARNLEDVYPHDVDLMLGHLATFARNTASASAPGGARAVPSSSDSRGSGGSR